MNNVAVLDVLLYGERIGTLTRLPGDRTLFAFTEAYIANRDRPTLSLSFKDALGNLITDVRPTQTRLPVFFGKRVAEAPGMTSPNWAILSDAAQCPRRRGDH